jgi:hypothetical protein
VKCPRERCLLEEHTGKHWFGSPQRSPGFVDDQAAVRDMRDIVRREAMRLTREGARLR